MSETRPRAGQVRTLFIDQAAELGGAQHSLLDILDAYDKASAHVYVMQPGSFEKKLSAKGFDVTVGQGLKDFISIPRGAGAKAMILPLLALLRAGFRAGRLARKYDLIYANTQKALLLGAVASAVSRKPLIWHLRDLLDADEVSGAVRKAAVFVANKMTHCVIANSKATAQAFTKCGGTAPLHIVFNGISSEKFSGLPVEKTLLKGLFPNEAAPVIGVFSRLAPWKGQHVAIEALRDLPSVNLVLVGGPLFGEQEYENRLKGLISEYGLADRVRMLGNREDVASLMAECDIIAHTSTSAEPFGRVVVEALMSRKPVIATRDGGVLEIVDDGVTGLLVGPGNVEELIAAVKRILEDAIFAESLANNGRQSAIDKFGIEAYQKNILNIIEDVNNHCKGR